MLCHNLLDSEISWDLCKIMTMQKTTVWTEITCNVIKYKNNRDNDEGGYIK